jgi:hypothetical protein
MDSSDPVEELVGIYYENCNEVTSSLVKSFVQVNKRFERFTVGTAVLLTIQIV